MVLRRWLRGLFGTSLTWALAWLLPAPFILHAYFEVLGNLPSWLIWRVVYLFCVRGALAGLFFGGVLMIAERRHPIETMLQRRFVLWGAAGALILPVITTANALLHGFGAILEVALNLGGNALLGAVCASGTLAVASRSDRHKIDASMGADSLMGEHTSSLTAPASPAKRSAPSGGAISGVSFEYTQEPHAPGRCGR